MRDILFTFLGAAILVLGIENYYLRKTVADIETRGNALLTRELNGTPLWKTIRPGTIALFAGKERTIVCGDSPVLLTSQAPKP